MKKILALSFLAIAALFLHACRVSAEVKALRNLKAREIVGLISERQEIYTTAAPHTETLPEPGTEHEDILERIDMLRDHLEYGPSKEWIQSVITTAEIEIRELREKTSNKKEKK